MIKKQKTIFLILFSIFYFLVSGSVFAAEIYFKTDSITVRPGDPLEVLVLLNTEEEDINAVEGIILFSEALLEPRNINEANSVLTFWPEKPRVYDGNKIKFAGIAPGGFQEKTGLLFSITFQAKKEGEVIIEIKDVKVLLNDGKGTPTNVKTPNFQLSIFKEAPISKSQILVSEEDKDSPEEFKPEIGQSPEMFGGKYFLVFATQDKGSGIDYYAAHESTRKRTRIDTKDWTTAESPYVLKYQGLRSFIYVKAVDKVGNERIAVVEPRYPVGWYEQSLVWTIIIFGLVIGYILWRRLKNIESRK